MILKTKIRTDQWSNPEATSSVQLRGKPNWMFESWTLLSTVATHTHSVDMKGLAYCSIVDRKYLNY